MKDPEFTMGFKTTFVYDLFWMIWGYPHFENLHVGFFSSPTTRMINDNRILFKGFQYYSGIAGLPSGNLT